MAARNRLRGNSLYWLTNDRMADSRVVVYFGEAEMSEIMSKLDGDGVIALFGVTGGLILGFVAILATAWTKVRQAEAASALKQDLAARGMSAEEICAMLEAGSKCSLRTLVGRVCG
jgi:hypothetical protein